MKEGILGNKGIDVSRMRKNRARGWRICAVSCKYLYEMTLGNTVPCPVKAHSVEKIYVD